MSGGQKSEKEQLEKLTEKHQQIQTGIKNLQNIEEGIFKNLEKAKKTQGSQTEQQELLNHITQLSSVREQLFKDLKKEYDKSLKSTLGGGDKLGTQTAMLNNTEQQLNKLKIIKESRDEEMCQQTLGNIESTARNGGNLLEVAIQAAKARATVGEISLAMENVFGRHQAIAQSISGVYRSEYEGDGEFMKIEEKIANFSIANGRRPRILVVKLGQDGHDRGAKVIATAFADMGFDVDIGPLFQTPEEAAKQAIENDVHILGVSTQAAAHKTLVPMLIEALKKQNAENILIVCGGIIPEQDIPELESIGVGAVFGPGTNIAKAALKVLDLIE